VVGVQHKVEAVRHLSVKRISPAKLRHILHPAHEFALRDDHRKVILIQVLSPYVETCLVSVRHLCAENLHQIIRLRPGKLRGMALLFLDKPVNHVTVNPYKP